MAKAARDFDIVLFGATGFTGKLTAGRLARRMGDESFTWAIAGRDKAKLAAVKAELVKDEPAAAGVGIIAADSADPASLAAMAKRAKVVVSTVGPYLRYGEPLVKACVEAGCDYADLTGEGLFVDQMIERYDEAAKASGARIVNCCGYDSIPADYGAWYTVRELPEGAPIDLACFASFGSRSKKKRKPLESVSGGTWHSAIGFMSPTEVLRQQKSYNRIAASAGDGRRVRHLPSIPRKRPDASKWGLPAPLVDNEIVLRTAAADPRFGPDFRYGHHFQTGSLAMAAAMAAGVGGLFVLAQIPPARNWLLTLRQPGEGPDADTRDTNLFRHTFVGTSGSQTVVTTVSGGDPGYGDTSKMLSETGLCLALDRAKGGSKAGGVMTPAMAMGGALLPRLERMGIQFETLSRV